jgi:hypothetical protein
MGLHMIYCYTTWRIIFPQDGGKGDVRTSMNNYRVLSLTTARASVYREIATNLMGRGYGREQYSVWQRDTTAAQAWAAMMSLREIRPRGILATVVRRLQMHRVPTPHVFIVTNDIRLGGNLSPTLIGPTPALLTQGMGVVPPPNWPNGPGDRLPFGVRNIPPSHNPFNWLI